MQPAAISELVAAIHARGCPLVVAVTGGGSRAISGLLTVPGASRTVLEAVVPYSAAAMTAWLGARPEQFCCDRTARAMAMAAFQRGRLLSGEAAGTHAAIIGLSCTASLASDRPKRGEHRAYAALQTAERTVSVSLGLERDARSRSEEEDVVAGLLLNLAAEAAGLTERLQLPLTGKDALSRAEVVAPKAWRRLLLGRIPALGVEGGQARIKLSNRQGGAVFPGAFNPLHDGHTRMARVAEELLGEKVEFEISIANVDKPLLDYQEIQDRLDQFLPWDRVWLTCAATFAEKARLFPGATMVVGVDTLRRIGDTAYYGGSEALRDEAVQEIAERGCRFLVFGRAADGAFRTLADFDLPPELAALCSGVPEDRFRADVSSTEIRRKARS